MSNLHIKCKSGVIYLKIKKLTGLDLREFDDAIVFKVALMVKKYLSNNPAKY